MKSIEIMGRFVVIDLERYFNEVNRYTKTEKYGDGYKIAEKNGNKYCVPLIRKPMVYIEKDNIGNLSGFFFNGKEWNELHSVNLDSYSPLMARVELKGLFFHTYTSRGNKVWLEQVKILRIYDTPDFFKPVGWEPPVKVKERGDIRVMVKC